MEKAIEDLFDFLFPANRELGEAYEDDSFSMKLLSVVIIVALIIICVILFW